MYQLINKQIKHLEFKFFKVSSVILRHLFLHSALFRVGIW